jgi:ribosome assembly protein YihI (activator of Der GTPase)
MAAKKPAFSAQELDALTALSEESLYQKLIEMSVDRRRALARQLGISKKDVETKGSVYPVMSVLHP